MKFLKKYKYIPAFIIYLIISAIILTILNLVFSFTNNTSNIFGLILIALYSIISGINIGKKTEAKAYKEGLKIGFIYIITMYILGSLFFTFKLPLKRIIYYLIILVCTIFGSIIGINKKQK